MHVYRDFQPNPRYNDLKDNHSSHLGFVGGLLLEGSWLPPTRLNPIRICAEATGHILDRWGWYALCRGWDKDSKVWNSFTHVGEWGPPTGGDNEMQWNMLNPNAALPEGGGRNKCKRLFIPLIELKAPEILSNHLLNIFTSKTDVAPWC